MPKSAEDEAYQRGYRHGLAIMRSYLSDFTAKAEWLDGVSVSTIAETLRTLPDPRFPIEGVHIVSKPGIPEDMAILRTRRSTVYIVNIGKAEEQKTK